MLFVGGFAANISKLTYLIVTLVAVIVISRFTLPAIIALKGLKDSAVIEVNTQSAVDGFGTLQLGEFIKNFICIGVALTLWATNWPEELTFLNPKPLLSYTVMLVSVLLKLIVFSTGGP